MGSGVSVDRSKNYTDVVNQSTLEQVKKRDVDCANKVTQFQANQLKNIDTTSGNGETGGDIEITQFAGLISNCVLTNSDKESLLSDIANDLAQKVSTDKGAAAAFSLAQYNEQENSNKIKTILKQKYNDVSNLDCKIDLLQSQQNVLNNIKTGGGNIKIGQTSDVQSSCQAISEVNRNAVNSSITDVKQTNETKIPSIIAYIVIGLVIIAAISGLVYAFAGDNAPERRRKFRQGISANFPGQQFTAPLLTAPPPQQYTDPNVYSEPVPQYQEPIQQLQQPVPLDASQIILT